MIKMIEALERCIDGDGYLELDRQQTIYLIFLLYQLAEGDGASIKFAIRDLMGTLPIREQGQDAV